MHPEATIPLRINKEYYAKSLFRRISVIDAVNH